MRKLFVYLDTSDFSRFAKTTVDPKDAVVFSYLVQKVNSGDITVLFSAMHMKELIQNFDDRHFKDRLQRAQVLSTLCANHCLRFFLDETDKRISTSGQWFPDGIQPCDTNRYRAFKDFVADFQKSPEFLVLPKRERRKLTNLAGFIKYAERNPSVFSAKNISTDFPIPTKFSDRNVMMEFLLGKIELSEFNEYILEYMRDPVLLVYMLRDMPEHRGFLSSLLDGHFAALDNAITLATSKFEELMRCSLELKTEFESLQTLGEKTLPNYQPNVTFPPNFLDFLDKRKRTDRITQMIEEIVFPDHFSDLREPFRCYLVDNILSTRTRVASDVIDLFHASYLPYVDIWRGDRYFSQMLVRHQTIGHSKVVAKLSELPDKIEKQLNSQNEAQWSKD